MQKEIRSKAAKIAQDIGDVLCAFGGPDKTFYFTEHDIAKQYPVGTATARRVLTVLAEQGFRIEPPLYRGAAVQLLMPLRARRIAVFLPGGPDSFIGVFWTEMLNKVRRGLALDGFTLTIFPEKLYSYEQARDAAGYIRILCDAPETLKKECAGKPCITLSLTGREPNSILLDIKTAVKKIDTLVREKNISSIRAIETSIADREVETMIFDSLKKKDELNTQFVSLEHEYNNRFRFRDLIATQPRATRTLYITPGDTIELMLPCPGTPDIDAVRLQNTWRFNCFPSGAGTASGALISEAILTLLLETFRRGGKPMPGMNIPL